MFIFVFTNLSEVHWRESTICASENIREERQIFLPYLSLRPSVLPSSHVKNVDLRQIIDGGVARVRRKYVEQVTFMRIGQNYPSFYLKGYVNFCYVYYTSKISPQNIVEFL